MPCFPIGLGNFVFDGQSFSIFKKIWLACVSDQKVLESCEKFLTLRAPISLEEIMEYVKAGSTTIGVYKTLINRDKTISKKNVIMAFAGVSHLEAMRISYVTGDQTNIWHRAFSREEYLMSHVIKPVVITKKNPLMGRLFTASRQISRLVLKNLFNPENLKIDDEKIQLVHFGLIVGELNCRLEEENNILNELTSLQKDFVDYKFSDRTLDYAQLSTIYERNRAFYRSLMKL